MNSAHRLQEVLSDATRRVFLEDLTDTERTQVAGCIRHLTEHPEPDGETIFDIPMYPIMFRSMKCEGFAITFRVQDGKALIYAIVRDGG